MLVLDVQPMIVFELTALMIGVVHVGYLVSEFQNVSDSDLWLIAMIRTLVACIMLSNWQLIFHASGNLIINGRSKGSLISDLLCTEYQGWLHLMKLKQNECFDCKEHATHIHKKKDDKLWTTIGQMTGVDC